MKHEADVVRSKSEINYDYATVRLTQSRIDKGLIAVPVSLARWFPAQNANIQIHFNDSPTSQSKRYSPYSGSTKECRIGGVRQWFEQNDLKSGDEIVIQLVDKDRFVYRLLPESRFIAGTQRLQASFDSSANEEEASEQIGRLSKWTNAGRSTVGLSEFRRLADISISVGRGLTSRKAGKSKESTAPSLRTLLGQLYRGHCQICDFWFLKKDNRPYFEVHHLDPRGGHHPKNLIVVCGNCHNQFEYADVKPEFNNEQWLIRVSFNRILHQVKQIVLSRKIPSFSKRLFV